MTHPFRITESHLDAEPPWLRIALEIDGFDEVYATNDDKLRQLKAMHRARANNDKLRELNAQQAPAATSDQEIDDFAAYYDTLPPTRPITFTRLIVLPPNPAEHDAFLAAAVDHFVATRHAKHEQEGDTSG